MNSLLTRTRAERLQIMLSGDELILIDDFRFQKRMPSRASAIRELLKRGLAAEGFTTAAIGKKSKEFGISGESLNKRADDKPPAAGPAIGKRK